MDNELKVGQKVRITTKDDIPEERIARATDENPMLWSGSKIRLCGSDAVVTDKLYSEAYGSYVYKLKIDGYDRSLKAYFIREDLTPIFDETTRGEYNVAVKISAEDVTCVIRRDGETLTEGRSHIIADHMAKDERLGIAQAISYAAMMAYRNIKKILEEVK